MNLESCAFTLNRCLVIRQNPVTRERFMSFCISSLRARGVN